MFRSAKRLLITSVAAACAAALIPVSSATAMSPCQGRSVVSTLEYRQTIAVAGVYTAAGATDVRLTCGIVRNGITVGRVSETLPGPVAAVAGTVTTGYGSFSTCYELYVTYPDRSVSYDYCP